MKILRAYAATMGLPHEGPVFQGVAHIDETATTWRVSFKPYGWAMPTAQEWVYKKKSHKEDGKTSTVLPKFWADYKERYSNK